MRHLNSCAHAEVGHDPSGASPSICHANLDDAFARLHGYTLGQDYTPCKYIGEQVLAWGPKDIFAVPRNAWTTHKAIGGRARLFRVNDFEMLRRLDLFRMQVQ